MSRAARADRCRGKYKELLSDHYENLTRALRRLGQATEAASLTLEQEKLWPEDAAKLSRIAGSLAQCIPLVGQGKVELASEDLAERRRYVDGAIRILSQAIAQGYRNVDELKTAKPFEELRADEEFKRLLTDLEEKAKANFK